MENGDKILMYATGGLTADAEELTYANGVWQQASPLTWNEQAKDAEVLAYYPAENIKDNNLYQENGALIDVLYNSQTVAYKNNITLSFGHLFSKLNFIIDKLEQQYRICRVYTIDNSKPHRFAYIYVCVL